jgi:hypothetical protein
LPVHAHVEREMVARAGGDAHEREFVRSRGRGHNREGPVPASHAEGVCAAGNRCLNERCQALAGVQNDSFDTVLAGPLGDPVARGRTAAGPGIDKQDGLPWTAGGVPAASQQALLDAFWR